MDEQKIYQGDVQALGIWWNQKGLRHLGQYLVLSLQVPPCDQEDILQETFLRLHQKVTNKQIKTNILGYAKTTVHNITMNLFRKQRDEKTLTDKKQEISRKETPCKENTLTALLERLSYDETFVRTFFQQHEEAVALYWFLKRIKNLRLKELATLTGISLSTLSGRILDFEKGALLKFLIQQAHEHISINLFTTLTSEKETEREEISQENLGSFLRSDAGSNLLSRLQGTQRKKASSTSTSRGKFKQTVGSTLWLMRNLPPTEWKQLSETLKLDETFIRSLAESAYPQILREYVLHQQTLQNKPPTKETKEKYT